MRIAFCSPMPPAKSGIADYSQALAAEIGRLAEVAVFDRPARAPDLSGFDVALYQIGNNADHAPAYKMALRHPGVVVMHEANLHHLIAEMTISRGDWDGYVEECAYDGGPAARRTAELVRAGARGPDYQGAAMTRRLLESARGLIVHSEFVAGEMRGQGYRGPIAVIPHGAWVAAADRNAARRRLGVDANAPLIGAFGYLKPYKRIAESLRAMRRLAALDTRVRMILVGEAHPDFPAASMIRNLGLSEHVRMIGFAPIEQFVQLMGACDIVLNLRYPTVGETSGSLQRALGLGKAVVVSDVGSFAELPGDICLKVPVDPARPLREEELIFEYLNVLVSRPDLASAMGERAKAWVERECNWAAVASRYFSYLGKFRDGRTPAADIEIASAPEDPAPAPVCAEGVEEKIFTAWVAPEARQYAARHTSRFVRTLEMIPAGDASKSILEMGAYMQITPALASRLGYGSVRGCYYGPLGRVDRRRIVSRTGELFECDVDHFDAERDRFPYLDESFDTVLCCELIEHLPGDPMHMMSEVNRILKPGGHFLLTTPNIASRRAVSAVLQGYHPAFFPAYIRPRADNEEPEARHNREYAPVEIRDLLNAAGFEIIRLETGEFLEEPHPEFGWVDQMLSQYRLPRDLRGDGIYALGRRVGAVRERWPAWLYS